MPPASFLLKGESCSGVVPKIFPKPPRSLATKLKYYLASPKVRKILHERVKSSDNMFSPKAQVQSTGKRKLTLYEKLYIDECKKLNRVNTQISHSTEKIEANKTGVLLHSKSTGENTILSSVKIAKDRFGELEGSEKERCQRNLRKIQTLKQKLLENENDYVQQFRLVLAFVQQYVNTKETLITEEGIREFIAIVLNDNKRIEYGKSMREIVVDAMGIPLKTSNEFISKNNSLSRSISSQLSYRSKNVLRGQLKSSNNDHRKNLDATNNRFTSLKTPKVIPRLVGESRQLGSVLGKFMESNMSPLIPTIPVGLSSPKTRPKEDTLIQKNKLMLEHVMLKRAKEKFDKYKISKAEDDAFMDL